MPHVFPSRPENTSSVTDKIWDPPMDVRRRQFLTSPGESLLLPLQALAIADRLSKWTRYSRLPKSFIISSPLLAVPIAQREPGKLWPADTEPSAFWHPILWLPERLVAPFDGERTDVWAVRVALEVAITGLHEVRHRNLAEHPCHDRTRLQRPRHHSTSHQTAPQCAEGVPCIEFPPITDRTAGPTGSLARCVG